MKTAKKALVTAITGQDGSCLTQLPLDKAHEVTGTCRRASPVYFWRIEELGIEAHARLRLVEFDQADLSCGMRLMHGARPGEV